MTTGDIIGEMSLLTGMPRSADVIATTPVDALEITKNQFTPILQARPQLAAALSTLLSARQAEQQQEADPQTHAGRGDRYESVLVSIQRFFGLAQKTPECAE